jgi:hypothetical protein
MGGFTDDAIMAQIHAFGDRDGSGADAEKGE